MIKKFNGKYLLRGAGLLRSLAIFLGVLIAVSTLFSPATLAEGEVLDQDTLEKIESVKGRDFVYIFCSPLDDLRVTRLIDGAKATADKFDLSVKFFGPTEAYDAEAVLAILKKLVEKSPKGIAMEIGHPSKFDETIGEAVDQEVYLISFSVDDWTHNPRQGYVGYDWRHEGSELAESLFGDMPPLSEILILDSTTKKKRSCHARLKGIITKLDSFNMEYHVMHVMPKKDQVKEAVVEYVKNNDVDGIVSLWGEVTRQLAQVVAYEDLGEIRVGGFGCGDFEKFVRSGSLDVLMKVVTQLEGGIPLENLYYSALYDVVPSTVGLHAKPVKQSE